MFPPRNDTEKFIDDLGRKFHIKEIAFDRWDAVQMVQNLEGLGFAVPLRADFKDMSPSTKRLMGLDRAIRNGGSVYDERGILSF